MRFLSKPLDLELWSYLLVLLLLGLEKGSSDGMRGIRNKRWSKREEKRKKGEGRSGTSGSYNEVR